MSIYDSVGGAPGVAAVTDGLYRRVLADPDLAPFFARTDMRHLKAHMRAFITAALGGPDLYKGRSMAAAHAGLGVTGSDFDAVVAHLAWTLTGLKVPAGTINRITGALTLLRDGIVTAEAPDAA